MQVIFYFRVNTHEHMSCRYFCYPNIGGMGELAICFAISRIHLHGKDLFLFMRE